jgi:hypothetical protein
MAYMNQNGDIVREFLYDVSYAPNPDDLWEIVRLLMEYLQVEAIRTNATKRGQYEIQIRSVTP